MDDIELHIVENYLRENKKYMEDYETQEVDMQKVAEELPLSGKN